MRGGLREMRMRLPAWSDQILMANRMSVRSETPAGKATTVGLSGSVTKRAQITGPLWSTTASQRLAGQSIAKGRIGREARRG
jgi:hypothetical protein